MWRAQPEKGSRVVAPARVHLCTPTPKSPMKTTVVSELREKPVILGLREGPLAS